MGMTEQEALKYMKLFRDEWDRDSKTKNAMALDVAINSLEKQIAKKVFQPFGTRSFKCSNCWKFVAHEVDDNCDLSQMAEWCPFCGQKLDWREDDVRENKTVSQKPI